MKHYWLRRTVTVLAVLAALALVLRLAVSIYSERRLERAREAYLEAVGPLDLARLELPELPDERNAATWIRRAAAANDSIPWDARLGRLAAAPSSSWSEDDLGVARLLLGEREEALTLLSRARSAGSSTFGIRYSEGFNAKMPDLLALVRVGKLEGIAGRLALVEESPGRLGQSIETLRAMAASLCRESTMVTLLIGSALDRLGMALLAERLTRGGLSESDLEAHRQALEARECGEGALRRALTAEAMVVETAPEVQAAMRQRMRWGELVADWAVGRPTSALMPAVSLEVRQRQIESLSLPFSEYNARWEAGDFFPDLLARAYDFAAPNLVAAIGNVKATETAGELARAAVRLALERRRTERFPPTLSLEATPYAGEVPVYTPSEDAAELSAPRSEQLWQELHPEDRAQPFPPAFRWRVAG